MYNEKSKKIKYLRTNIWENCKDIKLAWVLIPVEGGSALETMICIIFPPFLKQWKISGEVQKDTWRWCLPSKLKVKVKSFSCVQLFETTWTIAQQAPLSMEFSRQESWSGLPFPSPGDLPWPRDQTPVSCIAGRRFTFWDTRVF